jgi:hypothetical protein
MKRHFLLILLPACSACAQIDSGGGSVKLGDINNQVTTARLFAKVIVPVYSLTNRSDLIRANYSDGSSSTQTANYR